MIVNIRETWSCKYTVFIYPYYWINYALFNHWALSIYDILLTIYIYIIYIYIYNIYIYNIYIYINIYINHYYKLQKHNSTYCVKDHLLLIHHCILHNQYKNHKCPVFEYNSPSYIESGHHRTIFLNMRQNQLKKTKQIFWNPEILLITQRRPKTLFFMFLSLFVIAEIVISS